MQSPLVSATHFQGYRTNKVIYLTVLVNFINTYLLKLALVQTNPKYFETLDFIIFNTRNKEYFSYPSHRFFFQVSLLHGNKINGKTANLRTSHKFKIYFFQNALNIVLNPKVIVVYLNWQFIWEGVWVCDRGKSWGLGTNCT